MTLLLPVAEMDHVHVTRKAGDAAHTVITPEDVAAAIGEITQWEGYAPTPLLALPALAREISVAEIHYKDESPRFGLASFKALGGAYSALQVLRRQVSARLSKDVSLEDIRLGRYREECTKITLVSATDGNHGRSLAWGATRFGAPCRIYIHAEVSEGRAVAMRELGAEVIRIDGDYDDSVAITKADAEKNGWFVVSDTSWPGYSVPPRDVMAGYSVMVREICDAMDEPPTHVFLQAGVGGMAAGLAAPLRQFWGDKAPRAVVVEADRAPCLIASARAGKPVKVAIAEETIMAGLSCGEPSELAWSILEDEVSDFVTVPDSVIPSAVRLMARPLPGDPEITAGESAVAGLAALILGRRDPALSAAFGLDETSRVLLIGSEGITDPEIYAEIMDGRDAA